MPQVDPNRNLLFAILAVQMDFVPRDAMFSAMVAWTERKETPLGQILVNRGELSPARRALLEPLIDEHIKAHSGDPARSLDALSSTDEVGDILTRIPDAILQASLANLRSVRRSVATPDTAAPSDEAATMMPSSVGSLAPWTGRFRVVRPHAKGGLGVVSVAMDEELDREVAFKEIQARYADHPTSQARFLLEAEVTGKLEHPGIVPIYGLGHDPLGRPYYAMRFIRGDSLADAIHRFHDPDGPYRDPGKRALQLRELLGRFLDVCDALSYAHSRGVLHRDLKPGNVMLGPFGETLVVDWGLALPLNEIPHGHESAQGPLKTSRTDLGSLPSESGTAVGTPQYMPPEQAEGALDQLGPRSDVYGLGAILYDLLTGHHPVTGETQEEILKAVREGQILLPRQAHPDVPPALEAICLKALALRPDDRYATPLALAADIKSYLADEPVSAYREPLIDRARRWGKRHRVLVTSVAASLVVGLIGLASVATIKTQSIKDLDAANSLLTARNLELGQSNLKLDQSNRDLEQQRQRAVESEKEAIDAVKKFRDAIVNEPMLKNTPALEALRKRLLQEPLTFFKALRKRLQADNDTRLESLVRLADAVSELAVSTNEIGDRRDGLVALEESLKIFQSLATQNPNVAAYQKNLARIYNSIGLSLQDLGKPDDATQAYSKAKDILDSLVKQDPAVAEYQDSLAAICHSIGLFLSSTGKPDEALKTYKQALAIRKSLAAQNPTVARYQSGLALSYDGIVPLLDAMGNRADALHAQEQALEIRKSLANQNPTVTEYQSGLADSYHGIALLLSAMNKPDDAAKAYDQALAIRKSLAAQNPTVIGYQVDLAACYNNIGLLLSRGGKPADALKAHEQARDILKELANRNPSVPDEQGRLAIIHSNIGLLLNSMGKIADGIKAYEQALDIQKWLVANHPEVPDYFSSLGGTINNLAIIDVEADRFSEASQRLREAIVWQKRALASNPAHPQYRQYMRNHLTILRVACQKLEDRKGMDEVDREFKSLEDSDPAMRSLDARLAVILKGGQKPRDMVERLQLAQRAYDKSFHASAARLWDEVLKADPKLAENRDAQIPYNAACAAALAGTGSGKDDPVPTGTEKAALRGQARAWLKEEWKAWETHLASGQAMAKETLVQTLRHWKQDSDLAGVREVKELAKLPEAERADWIKLWGEVDALLKKAEGK